MPKNCLILMPSEKMDTNRKEGRNERTLIRMSKAARENLGLDEKIEVYNKNSTDDRIKSATLLEVYKAYTDDIRKAIVMGVPKEDLNRVGFVTTDIYNKLTGGKKQDIWVSKGAEDVVIGADPEFLLFEKDMVVRANNIMSKNGKVGNDGAMAELRPDPSIDPKDLTENIKSLFNSDLTDCIKKYTWKAACYFKDDTRDYPVGGHIHIGNPKKVDTMSNANRNRLFAVTNKIIDELLAIPMIKIDGKEDGKARRSECRMGHYGKYGDFRQSNGHLEHRTLSGLWLAHPELCQTVTGVAHAIAASVFLKAAENKYDMNYICPGQEEGYFNPWSDEFNWSNIPLAAELGCVKPSSFMRHVLNDSDVTAVSKKYLSGWMNVMKELPTYNTHSEYIDRLHEILSAKPAQIKEAINRYSLQEAWLDDEKSKVFM